MSTGLCLQVVHIASASRHGELRDCSTGDVDAANGLGSDVVRKVAENDAVAQRRGDIVREGHFKFCLQNLELD